MEIDNASLRLLIMQIIDKEYDDPRFCFSNAVMKRLVTKELGIYLDSVMCAKVTRTLNKLCDQGYLCHCYGHSKKTKFYSKVFV